MFGWFESNHCMHRHPPCLNLSRAILINPHPATPRPPRLFAPSFPHSYLPGLAVSRVIRHARHNGKKKFSVSMENTDQLKSNVVEHKENAEQQVALRVAGDADAKAKRSSRMDLVNELRNVAVVFVSLPELAASSVASIDLPLLNQVYVRLLQTTRSLKGVVRDMLFEDKGCTFIAVFGALVRGEEDALRAVLAAMEMNRTMVALKIRSCRIGTSHLMLP